MSQKPVTEAKTQVSRVVKAPRETVYRAFVEPDAVAAWLPPEGMKGIVHAFNPVEGGAFRMSLVYGEAAKSRAGKTTESTDSFHGRFVKLVPNETIVEVFQFESAAGGLHGEMKITVTLADASGGTAVTVLHEGIPEGLPVEDNEKGWKSSLQKLAALVE